MDKTGGPAFPETRYSGNTNRHPSDQISGMTLRDYFAGQALLGLLSRTTPSMLNGVEIKGEHEFVEAAYIYADAMIAATSMEGGEG